MTTILEKTISTEYGHVSVALHLVGGNAKLFVWCPKGIGTANPVYESSNMLGSAVSYRVGSTHFVVNLDTRDALAGFVGFNIAPRRNRYRVSPYPFGRHLNTQQRQGVRHLTICKDLIAICRPSPSTTLTFEDFVTVNGFHEVA